MTFSININGSAGPKFHESGMTGDMWSREIGMVQAVAREAIEKLQRLGITVSHADVNGVSVPPATTTDAIWNSETQSYTKL